MTNSSSNGRESSGKVIHSDDIHINLLHRDEGIVVIHKPSGLLVHRSPIDRHETRFVLQILRNQLGQKVFPIHRLDKPTSGLMVFALDSHAAAELNRQFRENKVRKQYLAVVRGHCPDSGYIDHALRADPDSYAGRPEPGPAKAAQTSYARLATNTLPVEIETYPSSRYSLVLAEPHTGRTHQIRRHFKHISHPIIGDAKHGRGRHNRYFAQHLGCARLLLHASHLAFSHPLSAQPLAFDCPPSDDFANLLRQFGWEKALPKPGSK